MRAGSKESRGSGEATSQVRHSYKDGAQWDKSIKNKEVAKKPNGMIRLASSKDRELDEELLINKIKLVVKASKKKSGMTIDED